MNAHATLRAVLPPDPDPIGQITGEGYLVSDETLARLGNGDVKRGRRELRMMLADTREPKVHVGPTDYPTRADGSRTVRFAGPADEQAILALVLLDHAENAAEIAPLDEDRILEHIRAGTEKKGGILGVVDGPDGTPVGTVCLMPYQWWFSKAYCVQEIWNFVHPDHRRSNHAADLIQFTKWVSDEWTRQFGYRVFTLTGVTATKRVREKIRLYRRVLTPVGAFFVYPTPKGFEP